MLELKLKAGMNADTLPRYESGKTGSGTLCQYGIKPENRYFGAKYLPYATGGINWIQQSASDDIISFPFSGCIMAVFTLDGIRRVCHVSTGEDGQDCMAEWKKIKDRSTNVFEFKPSDYIDTKGQALVGCYGLITGDLRTYAVTVVRNKEDNTLKIASINKARLLR